MRNLSLRVCDVRDAGLSYDGQETVLWYQDPDTDTVYLLQGSRLYRLGEEDGGHELMLE